MSWWNAERDPVRKALKNARQLRLGDTVQVGDVVKVVGFARADGPLLTAPLSDAGRCVLWETAVETLILGKRLFDDAAGTRFSVRGNGLRASVGARQVMALDARMTSDKEWLPLCPPGSDRDYLQAHIPRAHRNKPLRWAEWRIDQGDTVEIVGRVHEVMRDTARPESVLTADYRHAPEEELVGLEIEVGEIEVGELQGSWILVSLGRG